MAVVSHPWFASMQVLDGQPIFALEFHERFLKMGDHQDVCGGTRPLIGRIKSRSYTY